MAGDTGISSWQPEVSICEPKRFAPAIVSMPLWANRVRTTALARNTIHTRVKVVESVYPGATVGVMIAAQNIT